MCITANVSKLKRKHPTDDDSSLHSKKFLGDGYISKEVSCGKIDAHKTKYIKSKMSNHCPQSDGCARTSINGREWHTWSLNASQSERARVCGFRFMDTLCPGSDVNASQIPNGKGLSARTNRVKLRNLLAAVDGADLLKASQLKVT